MAFTIKNPENGLTMWQICDETGKVRFYASSHQLAVKWVSIRSGN